jgi:hypothetical protein
MKNHQNIAVQNGIEENLKSAREIALDKMMLMLNSMTEDKIKNMEVSSAANAANQMAGIHDKLKTNVLGDGIKAAIIYFAPRSRSEEEYPTLEAEIVEK